MMKSFFCFFSFLVISGCSRCVRIEHASNFPQILADQAIRARGRQSAITTVARCVSFTHFTTSCQGQNLLPYSMNPEILPGCRKRKEARVYKNLFDHVHPFIPTISPSFYGYFQQDNVPGLKLVFGNTHGRKLLCLGLLCFDNIQKTWLHSMIH